MQKSPSAAFIVEVEEFARLDFPSLDLESQELVRVELLDLLREAGSYELEAGLAADLLKAAGVVFTAAIDAGVFGLLALSRAEGQHGATSRGSAGGAR
jgi:hypothetical protein